MIKKITIYLKDRDNELFFSADVTQLLPAGLLEIYQQQYDSFDKINCLSNKDKEKIKDNFYNNICEDLNRIKESIPFTFWGLREYILVVTDEEDKQIWCISIFYKTKKYRIYKKFNAEEFKGETLTADDLEEKINKFCNFFRQRRITNNKYYKI